MKQNIPGFLEYDFERKQNTERIEREKKVAYQRRARIDKAARDAIEAAEKAKIEKAEKHAKAIEAKEKAKAEKIAKKEAERKKREEEKAMRAERHAKIKAERNDRHAKYRIIFLATVKKRLLSGIVIPAILSAGCLWMGASILLHDKTDNSKKMDQLEKDTIKASAGISIIVACALMLVGIIMVTARRKNLKPKHIYELMQELKSNNIMLDSAEEIQELGKIGLTILEKYSEIDDAYVNKLLNGDFTDDLNYDQAIAIIKGHLETHPEDLERVLSIYDAMQLPTNLFDAAKKTEEIQQAAEKLEEAQNKAIQQQYAVTRPNML